MRAWLGLALILVGSGCGEGKHAGAAAGGAGGAAGGSSSGGTNANAGSTHGGSSSLVGKDYALLPQELVRPSAVTLPDGDIFIYGGLVTRGSIEFPRGAQRYSVASGTFTAIDAMSTVLEMPSQTFSAVTPTGNVIVIDDRSGTDMTGRRYDLASDTWQELPPAKGGGILDAVVRLHNGEILVIQSAGAKRIDGDAGQWLVTGDKASSSGRGAAAVLADGRVLNVSGSSTATSLYEPESDTWVDAALPRIVRQDAALIGLPDGRALLVGGVLDSDDRSLRATVLETEIYDPTANAWSDGPVLTAAQTTPRLTLLEDDVIAWGGLSFPCDSAVPCGGRAVSRIDLAAGTVSALPDMSAPGTPYPFEIEPGDFLVILSSSYHRYSLETGPSKP